MTAINYEKYSNMNRRQLINSLISAEKKEQKIKAEAERKLSETNELIKFLKSKIKESLDSPKYEFVTREQSGLNKIANEVKNQISTQEKEQLKIEIQQEMSKDYGNEL
ncbi:hypothetical protein LS74_010620 [Helicobacter magdeburgensis]|uniref:Uncharacterized protein n=1 Tax=Helicobacter magdeburgensis TaxID=471858 RepID=A0A4U8SVU3_9HELI|nr:hypothetical protein [Helicobacter magdeburgensis]TLD91040.1 hypothetical protein LS74_010620 [Helicobacter magdeburgensis]